MPDVDTTPLAGSADTPASPSIIASGIAPSDREFTVVEKSQWQQAARRFLRHRVAMVSLIVFILLLLFAFIGPLVWKYKYNVYTADNSVAPSLKHPFGTDNLGFDTLAVVMRGTQQSLKIALMIALLAVTVGAVWGVVSGYFLGLVDSVLMRFADLVLTIPALALAAALANNTSGSWFTIAYVLGGLSAPYVARVVRGTVLSLREREFVEAARALGASNTRIMFRHLIPNALPVIIVNATLLVAAGILGETALSFLGVGVRAPDTSLGLQISVAQGAVETRPWLFYFPGVFIILIALSINFVGDGLRDALDPPADEATPMSTPYLTDGAADLGVQAAAPADVDALLVVDNLTVSFPTDDGPVNAVRGVSYTLRAGEAMGIVGESGSGKSVSSMAVMGLLPKNAQIAGSVRFRGQELLGMSEKDYTGIRGNKVAMIFQDPLTSLNPVYSVGKQISEAVLAHNDISKRAARDRAIELLSLVGIPFPEQRVDNYPHELSGGMRQRIVIAIAMANNPDVIIADEPTTALDVTVQAQVLEALEAARAETGAALVLITHDLGVIAGHAERISVMYAGKLVETGSVEDVFYRPRMPYTLGLLGSLPRLDRVERQRLTPIKGSPPSLLNLPPGCPFTPRCPMARDICDREEPALLAIGSPTHLSACHFREEMAGTSAAEVFGTQSSDAVDPAVDGAGPSVGAPTA